MFIERELREMQDDVNEKKNTLQEHKENEVILECPICMDEIKDFTQKGYTLSCGHSFCRDCLFAVFKNRVNGSINFSKYDQFCPQEGCKKKLIVRDFENILMKNQKVLGKLEEKNIDNNGEN